MKKILLNNGTKINCISILEAQMLDTHVTGYLENGIKINNGDTIIDVGANIGLFGFKLSKEYRNIKIFSFEPIQDIFHVLKANALLSRNENFHAFPYGISNKNESIEFTYYPNSPALSTSNSELWQNDDDLIPAVKGSLKNPPKSWWWAKFVPSFLYPFIISKLKHKSHKVTCNLKTLSHVIDESSIKKINLLKIDCEGNELKVLEGIADNNWDLIDQIVVEVHDMKGRLDFIKNMLNEKGYSLKIIKEPSLKETNLFNIFAIR